MKPFEVKLFVILTVAFQSIIVAMALAFTTQVQAQPVWGVEFGWKQTEQRADGTPLTEPEFIRNDIICAAAGVVVQNTDFSVETAIVTPWPHGTDTCYIITWATEYDNLTGELSSDPSASVQVILPKLLPSPSAPSGLTVRVVGPP